VPLELRAAIERRAVGPIGVLCRRAGLVVGQQLLEPADVPIDDCGKDRPRLVLVLGPGGDLVEVQLIPVREKGSSLISTACEAKEPRGHASKRLMQAA
jgi:hypothetical protein